MLAKKRHERVWGKDDYRRLERIAKGFASHRRLEIMQLLKQSPGLSVDEVSGQLGIGYINASDHLRKLAIAGLIAKHHEGSAVCHILTSRGEIVLVFCKTLK